MRFQTVLSSWLFLLHSLGTDASTPPNVLVILLEFTDLDLDAGEIGGPVTWYPPPGIVNVAQYNMGLATSSVGAGFSSLSTISVGTNEAVVPKDTSKGSYTHVVVYTQNGHGISSVPAGVEFVDASASVSSVACTDLDLDGTELGGDISWFPPMDPTANVSYYSTYLANTAAGVGRSRVGDVEVGTNVIQLPAETPKQLFSVYLVYTKSSFAEQTTPSYASVSDTSSPVTSLLFTDQDLDATQIGGLVSWTEPTDILQVSNYKVYWAQSTTGASKALIGTVTNGTSSLGVAADIPKSSKTHVVVYSESSLAEMTTPVATVITDKSSSVSSLAFADKDLDASEIGGDITFIAPPDVSQVTFYASYFAQNAAGVGRVSINTNPIGTSLPSIDLNTSKLGTYSYIVVYTRSVLAEQTTPVGLLIHDSNSPVTSLVLLDKDLDSTHLGGTITWTQPADYAQVVDYNVYFASSSDGFGRIIFGTVPLYTNTLTVPENTAYDQRSYLVVYSRSSLDESSYPTSFQISDSSSLVTSLSFSDYDLDANEFGGSVTWNQPGDVSQASLYRGFLATNAAGLSRSQIGSNLNIGVNTISIPMNTNKQSFTQIVVYTSSALYEQTTPTALTLQDYDASVSSLVFVDKDLDTGDLGGAVEWNAPGDVTKVTHYTAYLSTNAAGASRSQIGSVAMGVNVGVNTIAINGNTAKGSMKHVIVFTRNLQHEQTTPTAISVVDNSAVVNTVTFPDLDLDKGQLAGTLTWSAATVTTHVTYYTLYLASGATAGASRSKLGSDLAVGTQTLSLLADVPLQSYTHFVVFCKSTFTIPEQTTPAGNLQITDRDGTVTGLNFGDRDFDVGEIGGDVKWTAPLDVSFAAVQLYRVYRATNAAGNSKAQIGSDVPVGTNTIALTVSTAVGSYTHMVVYSKNSMGEQTTPASVQIADMPATGVATVWTVSNAESTTPVGDGRQNTAVTGLEWTLHSLEFYSDAGCTDKLTGTFQSSGQTGKYHGPAEAFDNTTDTVWQAQCAPCNAFEAHLGIEVSSAVECVKWLQPPVVTGRGTRSVALQIGYTELARATNLVGGMWEGLFYGAGGWHRVSS